MEPIINTIIFFDYCLHYTQEEYELDKALSNVILIENQYCDIDNWLYYLHRLGGTLEQNGSI